MNAEDITIGMKLEAADRDGGRWYPVRVSRRFGADEQRHLFEVRVTHGDRDGIWLRNAEELRLRQILAPAQVVRIVTADASPQGYPGTAAPHRRPKPAEGQAVSRVAAAAGGSIAVWPVVDGVAVEVEVPLPRRSRLGPPRPGEIQPVASQGILVPAGEAVRMARSLRAGTPFYFATPGAAICTASIQSALIARIWPDGQPTVLIGRVAASLLAGLVESATSGDSSTRSRPGLAYIMEKIAERNWDPKELIPPEQCQSPDDLAGARRRTDDNLRKAFGF